MAESEDKRGGAGTVTGAGRIHSRLEDLLRLDTVRRWEIVEVDRSQSVAEHSFRVAVLALEFLEQFGLAGAGAAAGGSVGFGFGWQVLRRALVHDGPEARTGDLDGHLKLVLRQYAGGIGGELVLERAERELCPWLEREPPLEERVRKVVKLLDRVETLLYLERWGRDPDSATYLAEIEGDVRRRAAEVEAELEAVGIVEWVEKVRTSKRR